MKSFIRGRKAMLTMIRKCKYKEILQKVCFNNDNINNDTINTVSLFQSVHEIRKDWALRIYVSTSEFLSLNFNIII